MYILFIYFCQVRYGESGFRTRPNHKYMDCIQISLQSVCYEEILGSHAFKLGVEVALLLGGFPLWLTDSILSTFAQGANWIRRAT